MKKILILGNDENGKSITHVYRDKKPKPRSVYITPNRLKIIEFAKSKLGIVTKSQVIHLLSCTPDNAYEQIKSMVKAGLLEKVGTQKFRFIQQ